MPDKIKAGDVVIIKPECYSEKMLIKLDTKMTVESFSLTNTITIFFDESHSIVYRASLRSDMLQLV